jgi:phosphonate transport system ATP-binding protein
MDIMCDQIVLVHGTSRALDAVSLMIPAGQIVVLLGPSGAGKTSLLKLVAGLAQPTSGRLWLGGVAAPPAGAARRVAMVHQQHALVPRASVAANIAAGALAETPLWRVMIGRYHSATRARAVALAAAVGLGAELLARPAGSLSGGQQQRVGVARACMLAPAILLADEPVASLDPENAAAILALLADRARATRATLLVSLHQVELARRFADRIIGLRDGRILFDGPPAGLDAAAQKMIFGEPGQRVAQPPHLARNAA